MRTLLRAWRLSENNELHLNVGDLWVGAYVKVDDHGFVTVYSGGPVVVLKTDVSGVLCGISRRVSRVTGFVARLPGRAHKIRHEVEWNLGELKNWLDAEAARRRVATAR